MANMKSPDPRLGSIEPSFASTDASDPQSEGPRSAREAVLSSAERQKTLGADLVSSVAGAIRKGASELDQNVPQAAGYIRYAADQVEGMSETLRHRDMGQLVSDVESFARRQPTAFMGATFLAGFMAIRFLKSSGAGSDNRGPRPTDDDMASDWQPPSSGF